MTMITAESNLQRFFLTGSYFMALHTAKYSAT